MPEPTQSESTESEPTQPESTEPGSALRLVPQLLCGSVEDLRSGTRPVLVLGPSLGTSVAVLWEGALEYLQQSFTVIGWDLPGHADAEPFTAPFEIADLADALEELLAQLTKTHGIPEDLPVYAAGVSIAGTVSLTLALRPQTRFTRLVALCTAAKIGDPQMWSERAELVAQAGTPTMVEGSAQRWFAPGFMARQPAVVTGLLRSLQHTDRGSYAQACRALGRYDLRPELAGVARPLLVISGAQDPVCPPSAVQDLAAAPHTRTAVLDGVAHQAPAEAPDATARLLKEFLND